MVRWTYGVATAAASSFGSSQPTSRLLIPSARHLMTSSAEKRISSFNPSLRQLSSLVRNSDSPVVLPKEQHFDSMQSMRTAAFLAPEKVNESMNRINGHVKTNKSIRYLHVGPTGDCWTGDDSTISGAEPGYVKSIPLSHIQNVDDDSENMDNMVEFLEDNPKLTLKIYDYSRIPSDVLDYIFRRH